MKFRLALLGLAFFVFPSVFAAAIDDSDMSVASSGTQPCLELTKACMEAGYIRREHGNKKIWENCMKPILMGQTVNGVKIAASAVNTCREQKIKRLRAQIQELQKMKNS